MTQVVLDRLRAAVQSRRRLARGYTFGLRERDLQLLRRQSPGLSTTMGLVANRRPFIYVPLRNHFEQNFHVANCLRRYGAPPPTDYDEATPQRLAALMRERLGAQVVYKPAAPGGAAQAASLIAPQFARTLTRA